MQIVMPRGELQVHVAKDNGILRDAWLPNGKMEKTTVYLLFSIFIQFSAVEIR